MRRNHLLFLFLMLAAFGRLSAQVHASFTASSQFGCPPLIVTFTDQSTGNPTSYQWQFDNGNTSTNKNPTEAFVNPGVYNVLEIVTNGSSTDSMSMQINVYQPPTVNFLSFDNVGCANPCHMVNFIDSTLPGASPLVSYAWDFGDGSLADSTQNPSHCYSHTGDYSVILVVRDRNGCQVSKTLSNYVVIAQAPTATVSASPSQTCNTSLLVHFTGGGSSNNGSVSYAWYFGNGNTSAQQNPSENYNAGIYSPILVVTDSLGCQDTARTQVAVTDVHAAFGATTTNACSGLTVQFGDSSNYANSWLWNFGDGGTSTLQNPTHIYANNGTYTVSLTVAYGPCRDSITRTNYIHVTPPVNFTISASPTSACTGPLTVNFSNTAGAGASSFNWNFGDGSFSTLSSPTHVYTATGSYTVSLGVANSAGCVNTVTDSGFIKIGSPKVTMSADSFGGCAPLTLGFTSTYISGGPITSYNWVFGDGGTSNTANPHHTFNTMGDYLPMLIVTNAAGCADTVYAADSVKVGSTLIPNFIAAPLVQCIEQNISFTNQTVGGNGQTVYLWNFGDGQTSNQINPNHSYSDTGFYNITLTVTNQGCKSDTERLKYIQIVVPKSQFLYKFPCSNPTAVTFKDTSQGAQTWLWEFGDGTTSTAQNPGVHNYATQGNYTVTLIVTNTVTGCTDSSKQTLAVGTPTVAFASDVRTGCVNLTVHFSDSSAFATSWLWRFGDGGFSTSKNPVHTYSDTGKYTVTLFVNPGSACVDSLVVPNYITVFGIIGDPIVHPSVGCSPLTVAFTDSSASYQGTITSWKWHFGVGNDSSDIKSPSYLYTSPLNYTVNLKVTDSHGCTGSFNRTISLKSATAYFTSDTILCPGEKAHFFNFSQNAGDYLWEFGDGTTSIDSNPLHSYAQSGLYTVTLIAINTTYGCRDTFASPIPVHVDTPLVDFSPSSIFSNCPPFPVQFSNLTTRNGLTWLWQFGDGDTSTAVDPFHIYIYPGYYNVTLIGTDTFGCKGSREYVDLIQIKGPIGHFAAAPTVGCVPLTVSFSGTTQSTQSSIFVPGPGAVYNNQINVSYTFANSGEYEPTYTLTDSFGCTVPYPLPVVIVGAYPVQNLPDTTICKGNYVQLNLPPGDSLQIGEKFQWSSNRVNSFLSCDTCSNPLSTSPDTITYYISSTSYYAANNDTAVCIAKDTFVVNVDALPLIFPGIDFRICPNDTLQLHAGPGVTQASWTPDVYISDTGIANPKAWPPDTTIYRVTGTNDAGCSISRIVRIWPITKVVADISVSDTTVCAGAPVPVGVVVTQASINDTTFQWSPAKYLNSPDVQNTTAILPPGEYSYTVIVRSRTCIADTATMHIAVSSAPDLEAGDNQTVAYGTTVQLYAASHQSVNYQWAASDDSFSCTDCRRPYVTVKQTQTVYVTATNEYGCKTVDSVQLKVVECDQKMIFVPNTFTPNGDGLNDVLYVRGAGLRALEYFRVFDRWGNLVFQTNNISEGWDGTVKGKIGDVATYVYVLKGICSSGVDVEMSGNVTLVR